MSVSCRRCGMGDMIQFPGRSPYEQCIWLAEQGIGAHQIANVQAEHPTLTWEGFWSPQAAKALRLKFGFQDSRDCMLTLYSLKQFHFASVFLASFPRQKTMNRRIGTGTLKHIAEAWWKERHGRGAYIPRGMFIAAAIAGGFRVQRIGDGWDAHLDVSRLCRDLPSLLRHQEQAAAAGGA